MVLNLGLLDWDTASSSQEIELMVNLSTCTFNSGFTWTFKNLFPPLDIQLSKDNERILYRQNLHISIRL